MELRDYLESAAKKAGSLSAVGRMLELQQQTISAAKSHKRPLPLDACIKLADYINADRLAVIAANELATEKKEEKRTFWTSFLAIPTATHGMHFTVKKV